ncbi:MAG: lysophospholipid acyltransferase family protein [Planctomycetota bacterium]
MESCVNEILQAGIIQRFFCSYFEPETTTQHEMGFLDDPPRPLLKRILYDGIRSMLRVFISVYFRARIHGIENFPGEGGMIICANHVSNLDPIVIGCAVPRRTNFLAKISLIKTPGLGWLIDKLDAIPINREAGGASGMKETLRRLKRNESVLIFPEGTRSPDGTLQPVQSGVCALIKRVKSPVIPVAICGTFEAWPRKGWFPIPCRVEIVAGEPISNDDSSSLETEELVQLLQSRIAECYDQASRLRSQK